MADRINFSVAQRESMLAPPRQAAALEKLVMLFEAYLRHVGVELPEPIELVPDAAAQSFNPYTESAPGVPLPGQEVEESADAQKAS